MKDKNKQSDYDSMTLEELTNEANRIINFLENHENIENETESYQNLLKLNGYIEKKFSSTVKNINIRTKEKIISLSSKKNAN
tara:strand:+ start:220 stop:465 length:246 start_codon:yes stop_codon:yes gene_type:complete